MKERYLEGKNYSAWTVGERHFDPRDLSSLIQWAILAPSSHNTQPWAFSVGEDFISISPDPERALSVSDPTRREMYISIGAAIGNLKIAAHRFGYYTEEELIEDRANGISTKQIKLKPGYVSTEDDVKLFEAITKRVSNRSPHQEKEVPQEMREAIVRLTEVEGVDATLVEDKERKSRIGLLVYAGERMILSDPGFTGELSKWVRPNTTTEYDGMPGFGFGMPDFASRLLPAIIRSGVMASGAAEQSRVLLTEKTGSIGVISTKDDTPESWMKAGEAFEQIALKAASMGLSVNVLAVLVETRDFHQDLQALVGTDYRPAIMFRLGYPIAETPHAPRRLAKDVMPVGFEKERGIVSKDRPKIFTLRKGAYEFEDLRRELGDDTEVIDLYGQEFLAELFYLQHPKIDFRTQEGQQALEGLVKARNNDYDGVWVYFPWKRKLAHILKEDEFYQVLYSRNNPCIEPPVQEKLGKLRVGVIGLSVGRDIAVMAAATGIRHLKIADFDTVALSNTPRMGAASTLEIGENKTRSLARELYEFNPYMTVEQFRGGLHDANLETFMDGLTVVVDHMDNIPLKLEVRDLARKRGIPVFMATDIFLTPIFDVELPENEAYFGGRASKETLARLRKPPESFAQWAKMAVEVFGLENAPAAVLRNFIAVHRGEQNYGSQLALTGYAAAAQIAYFLYEVARGNLGKLDPFKTLHIEQPDLFDPEEDGRSREEFKKI